LQQQRAAIDRKRQRTAANPRELKADARQQSLHRLALRRGIWLIILDLNLPGLGRLELLRRMIQQGARPILVLTMHASRSTPRGRWRRARPDT